MNAQATTTITRECDVRGCGDPGSSQGIYSMHGRPGRMCERHAYDPRNGFTPRPYVRHVADHYARTS